MQSEPAEQTLCIEITAGLGRQAFEALYLELRRLAKQYGTEVSEFRVERVAGPGAHDTAATQAADRDQTP
jgi:hypothetical protein